MGTNGNWPEMSAELTIRPREKTNKQKEINNDTQHFHSTYVPDSVLSSYVLSSILPME